MSNNVLSGVVALVSFRPDKTFNFKQTVSTKLTDLGARVTSRFSRDVTHVVFQKRLKPTPEQQVAEASDLRALYDKAAKASFVRQCLATRMLSRLSPVPPDVGRHSSAHCFIAMGGKVCSRQKQGNGEYFLQPALGEQDAMSI